MCSAVHAAAGAADVPLLQDATLKLSSLAICPEAPFHHMKVQLSCSYMDQLGGPVFYRQEPLELDCTDSYGNKLKIYDISSDAERVFESEHADPVRISLTIQPPSPGAEWVRIRGFLLCAFGDRLEELPSVVLPVREEGASHEIPLGCADGEKVKLSLKKFSKTWDLRIEGKKDFHFYSFAVRCEDGSPLKGRGKMSGLRNGKRSWGRGFFIPERTRSLKVGVSYWSEFMLRKVPVDFKISVGGVLLPFSASTGTDS